LKPHFCSVKTHHQHELKGHIHTDLVVNCTFYLSFKSSPTVEWPGEREADHSSPSISEIKNSWYYTPLLQYVFMAWYLVKHRDITLHYITLCHSSTENEVISYNTKIQKHVTLKLFIKD